MVCTCPCVGGVQDKIRVPALAGQELTYDSLQPTVARVARAC